jgi:2-(3-amino-3-carboxypropyl)histidine synthase
MPKKSIEEIQELYDLELEKVISKIKKAKAKNILLQFPDGLKPYATTIVDYLERRTKGNFLIWMETCFGACDTPILGEIEIDLIIQFGHNENLPSYSI